MASGGAVVIPWTFLTGLTTATSTGSGTLPLVSQGGPYLIQIQDGVTQPTSGPLYSAGTTKWGVGALFLFEGQSNMASTLHGAFAGYNVPGTSQDEYTYYKTGAVVASIWDNAGWHPPSNGSVGASGVMNTLTNGIMLFMRIVAAAMRTKYGYDVPIGIIPYALASQSIESFTAPSGIHYTDLFNATGTSGTTQGFASPSYVIAGDFEGVLWHQGEANANDSAAVYQAKLQALYQTYLNYVAPFGRTATNLFFGPAVIGNYETLYKVENIRQAEMNFETYAHANGWPLVQVGWTTIDLWRGTVVGVNPPTDSLHFQDPTVQRRSMKRCVQTVLKWLGASGNGPSGLQFSGRGPTISSVSRVGDVATFIIAHEGGTALQVPTPANPPTGFYANTAADFSGTDVLFTAALVAGNTQVALTFSPTPTYPVYVKYLGYKIGNTVYNAAGFNGSSYPDISNPIYDNTTYPNPATGIDVEALGLPLLPTNGAITVS